VQILVDSPILTLALILAIGSGIGMLRIRGVAIGPAAVLFTALALSAYDARLAVPEVVGTFGLAVFTYSVGLIAGPSFFAGLRRGAGPVGMVVSALVAVAFVAWGLGKALGLSAGVVAGLYAGSATNTPALAAAMLRLDGSPEPTVGYSLSYLGGVLIMLLAVGHSLRAAKERPTADDRAKPEELITTTIRVTHDNVMNIRELTYTPYGRVIFSRYLTADGELLMTDGRTVLRPGDRVNAVGPRAAVRHITKQLGRTSKTRLTAERTEVDFRRIVLSRRRHFGRTVADLLLWQKFGARPTRVRRADQDFLATDDFVLQAGDRIRVAAPPERMVEVADYLGDSDHATADINPLGLFLGLVLGLVLGALPLPVPGFGNLTLGAAAGPLLAGLVLGRLSRSGRVIWTLPHTAAQTLTQVGMLLFLAFAGGRAGSAFIAALSSNEGIKLIAAGVLLTALHAGVLLLVGRRYLQLAGPRLAGIIAGSQTQPALLAYANDNTEFDQRVALGYALVYPVAMVVKILAAQILTML